MAKRALCVLFLFLLIASAEAGCVPTDPATTVASASPALLSLPTRAPRTPTPISVDRMTYYRAGLACQQAGDTECALQSFTWAITLDPDFAAAYVARGSTYLALGEMRMAQVDADRALDIDSTSAAAYALRGEVLRLRGRHREAVTAFNQAAALDPALGETIFHSRWLAARAADDAARLGMLSYQYGKENPDDALYYYYRGWALIERPAPSEAIALLVEGIESTTDAAALLWFTLGHAYMAARAWPEAVTCFEASRELLEEGDTSLDWHTEQPTVELFGALGRAYLKNGRCADAQTMLEYAIAVGASPLTYGADLRDARLCLTSIPTPTPYVTTTPPFW